MILEKVSLQNWQPYFGKGKDRHVFDFTTKKSNLRNSAILYGENTQGKSSFWEAIRFALHGTVPITQNADKPLISFELDERPLLNVEAYEAGDYLCSVELGFSHDGKKYNLTRSFYEKPTVTLPRNDYEMTKTLDIKISSTGKPVTDPQKFINDIIPENLLNFFMFDGERIEDYKQLLWDTEEIVLVDDIEKILRLTMFTDGISGCYKIARSVRREIVGYDANMVKDASKLRKIRSKKSELDSATSDFELAKNDLDQKIDDEANLAAWLSANDKAQLANQIIESSTARIKAIKIEKGILKNKRSKLMNKSWTAIMQTTIKNQIKAIQQIIDRQSGEGQKIIHLGQRNDHLRSLIAGEKCKSCNTQLKSPLPKDETLYLSEIEANQSEIESLTGAKASPDPHDLITQERSLRELLSGVDLSDLKEINTKMNSLDEETRIEKQKLDKSTDSINSTKRSEVATKHQERITLIGEIAVLKGLVSDIKEYSEELEREHSALVGSGSAGLGSKTVAHKKAELKVKLLTGLDKLLEHTKLPFREKMKTQVEKYATAVFLRCTNMRDTYAGLKIDNTFKINIIKKDGKTDAGSKGQMALVAYSMLDALTRCSSIEFPFIIDTPGRSLDSKNMQRVFDHIFDSNRQVICLPTPAELDPDTGDIRYAANVAVTYGLKNNNNRSTATERIRIT